MAQGLMSAPFIQVTGWLANPYVSLGKYWYCFPWIVNSPFRRYIHLSFIYIYMHIHTYIHTYFYLHIYIYIHIHLHIFT